MIKEILVVTAIALGGVTVVSKDGGVTKARASAGIDAGVDAGMSAVVQSRRADFELKVMGLNSADQGFIVTKILWVSSFNDDRDMALVLLQTTNTRLAFANIFMYKDRTWTALPYDFN